MSLYTQDEEAEIVNFIVKNEYFHRIKGDQVWKEMEEAKIVDRTWQSLKQHFRKKIIYEVHYPRYNLDERSIRLFKDHFNRVPVTKRNKMKLSEPTPTPQTRKVPNFEETSSDDSDD